MRFLTHLLLFLLISIATVRADDGGNHQEMPEGPAGCPDLPGVDDSDDCERNRERRFNRVDLDNNGFRFTSRSESATSRDLIDLQFKGEDNRLEIDWRVRQATESTRTGFRFRLRLLSLIEYEKAPNSTSNEFVAGVDTFCGARPIRGDAYTWSATPEMIGNVSATAITAAGPRTKVVAHIPAALGSEISARPFFLDNVTVTPRSFKFDIDLNLTDYQWSTNCTSQRIGIVALVKSMSRISQDNTTIIHFGAGAIDDATTTGGIFTWRPDAVVDNTTVSVLASRIQLARDSDDDRNGDDSPVVHRAVFAFDAIRPTIVNWDPQMSALALSTSSSAVFGAASALVAALFALLF